MSDRRGVRRVVAAIGVLALVAGVVAVIASRDGGGDGLSVKAIEAYEERISGPAAEGGFVIEQGMKPAVGELGTGGNPPVVMQAVSWVNQLKAVRAKFAASRPPKGLALAAKQFDEALALYIDAAERIGAAGIATGDVRTKILQEAVDVAKRADRRYDLASAKLQHARRQHGLEPSHRFPDPEDT